MRILLVVLAISFTLPSWSTVRSGLCPEAFEGRVKVIAEELGPGHAFSSQKVIFSNQQTLRGEVSEEVLVDMLSNGPFKIEPGKEYRVQLRKGKLCWIEAI